MVQFILNKFFYGILTLFGVVTVIFLLFNVLPGDPARMMLDQREDSEQLQNIRKKYGFDQSLTTQYFYYLNDACCVCECVSERESKITHVRCARAEIVFLQSERERES